MRIEIKRGKSVQSYCFSNVRGIQRPKSRGTLASSFFAVVVGYYLILLVWSSSMLDESKMDNYVSVKPAHYSSKTNEARISRQAIVCNQTNDFGQDWVELCHGNFVYAIGDALLKGNRNKRRQISDGDDDIHMIQIGAHVGFEPNDPFAKGMIFLLNLLTDVEKKKFHWTFVEPSPPNYKRLMQNIAKYSHLCDMQGINAAVVPDSLHTASTLKFYSVHESVDPETGFDSRSGKTLPYFITQISALSKQVFDVSRGFFLDNGLNMEDYIVIVNVTAKRYSDLIGEILHGPKSTSTRSSQKTENAPMFVLIDTEGLDCDIVLGISADSPYLPQYLIFEHDHCRRYKLDQAVKHLELLGYSVKKIVMNIIAIKQ